MLWFSCRGVDNRQLKTTIERKSIGIINSQASRKCIILFQCAKGVDINYGIRFDNMTAAEEFVRKLCVEIFKRLDQVRCAH